MTLFSVIWLGSIWLNVTDSLPATSKVFQLMTALDVVWLMTVFVGRPATLPGLSCQMKALPCVTVPLVGAARACGARALSPAAATAASTARAPETPDFHGGGRIRWPRSSMPCWRSISLYESCSWDSFWGWMTCRILRGTVLLHSGAAGQK